jgi:membrane-associated phospholipid phosphatase
MTQMIFSGKFVPRRIMRQHGRARYHGWVAAGVVAFSRVYTGVHYPGDVIAGATIGALVGWATSAVARRLHRSLRRSTPSGGQR